MLDNWHTRIIISAVGLLKNNWQWYKTNINTLHSTNAPNALSKPTNGTGIINLHVN